MSFILQIDTAFKTASISLSFAGELIFEETNTEMKDHAAFVQPAIKNILQRAGISAKELAAIAVCYGPGSYTGLRIGMASAKGLCYALNKPLVTIGSLQVLTRAVIEQQFVPTEVIYCPMIDARRMEVYTALFDANMSELLSPVAMVLTADSFANWLLKNTIWFFGDGAAKFIRLIDYQRAVVKAAGNNALAMSKLAFQKYELGDFADNAYVEPLYLKDFFSPNITPVNL